MASRLFTKMKNHFLKRRLLVDPLFTGGGGGGGKLKMAESFFLKVVLSYKCPDVFGV